MSNYKDIQKKSDKDITASVQEARETLRAARFATTGAGSADVKKIRESKKVIAQSLTELNARKRQEANKSA